MHFLLEMRQIISYFLKVMCPWAKFKSLKGTPDKLVFFRFMKYPFEFSSSLISSVSYSISFFIEIREIREEPDLHPHMW